MINSIYKCKGYDCYYYIDGNEVIYYLYKKSFVLDTSGFGFMKVAPRLLIENVYSFKQAREIIKKMREVLIFE